MSRQRSLPFCSAAAALSLTTGLSASIAAPSEPSVQGTGPAVVRRSAPADTLRGPFKSLEEACVSLRRAVCRSWEQEGLRDEDSPRPRSVCSQIEVPVQGPLRPPFLDARGVRATCGLGSIKPIGQVRLVVRTAEGWYLGPQQLEELEDRKVSESTTLHAISTHEVEGAQLLVAPVRHRCTLVPARLDEGAHELTMDSEALLVVGTGPSGRPSALTYELGSTLTLRTLPDLDAAEGPDTAKKRPGREPQTVLDDVIDIGWHVRPGLTLQLDEPQGIHRGKQSRKIPYDIPCAESQTFGQRLKHARRLSGIYPLRFR